MAVSWLSSELTGPGDADRDAVETARAGTGSTERSAGKTEAGAGACGPAGGGTVDWVAAGEYAEDGADLGATVGAASTATTAATGSE